MLHGILGHDHIHWQPQLIRHYTNLWTFYRTGPYYRIWPYYQISGSFHKTLQRVRLAKRGRLLLRTPCPVPFGTCICSNVETIFSWPCHVFGLWISNIPRYFYCAYTEFWMHNSANYIIHCIGGSIQFWREGVGVQPLRTNFTKEVEDLKMAEYDFFVNFYDERVHPRNPTSKSVNALYQINRSYLISLIDTVT